MNWTVAALTPRYLRSLAQPIDGLPVLPDVGRVSTPLYYREQVEQLSAHELHSLPGQQVDDSMTYVPRYV